MLLNMRAFFFFTKKTLLADKDFTMIFPSESLGLTLGKTHFYGRCKCLLLYCSPQQEFSVTSSELLNFLLEEADGIIITDL